MLPRLKDSMDYGSGLQNETFYCSANMLVYGSGLQNVTFLCGANVLEGLWVLEDNALEGLSALEDRYYMQFWVTACDISLQQQRVGRCVRVGRQHSGRSVCLGEQVVYTVLGYRMWYSIAATTCLKVCLCWGTGWWYLEKTTRTRPRQENSSSL